MTPLKIHNGGRYALMEYLTCWKCVVFHPVRLLVNYKICSLALPHFKLNAKRERERERRAWGRGWLNLFLRCLFLSYITDKWPFLNCCMKTLIITNHPAQNMRAAKYLRLYRYKINKKPITAATTSYVKLWSPIYSGEYIAID